MIHRWRYANVERPVGKAYLLDRASHLAACGDWCIDGRIEAAYLSGAGLADPLCEIIEASGMNATPRNVATALTYMGALPFWLLILAPETVLGIKTASVFLSYGAIISSFMAETLWGTARAGRSDLLIILTSNVFALITFASLLVGLSVTGLIMQMGMFGFVLFGRL